MYKLQLELTSKNPVYQFEITKFYQGPTQNIDSTLIADIIVADTLNQSDS